MILTDILIPVAVCLVLVVLMLATCALCFASCQKSNDDFVATDATDLIKEDFGIGVKKGNAALLAAVNAVVDKWVADGTMAKYEEYYTKLADFSEDTTGSLTKPEAGDLKVTWDFGSATEAITVYTESGFAPFEFVYDGAVVGLDIAIMNEYSRIVEEKYGIHPRLLIVGGEFDNTVLQAIVAFGRDFSLFAKKKD